MRIKRNYTIFLAGMVTMLLLNIDCSPETYSQGQRLYAAHCENCHMEDGTGLAKLIPPLAASDYLRDQQGLIPCILRHGQNGEIMVNELKYNQEMPGQKYTEVQITNIINYINNAWGNEYGVVTLEDVTQILHDCSR